MGRGLDRAGRDYIRSLIERSEKGDYVQREIDRLLKDRDWDYSNNKDFVEWLRRKGWKSSATYLWNHISG
jgi:hypothetical protein